jgi:hypothetical protein
MEGNCKDRPTGEAIKAFLDVSRQAAQRSALVIGNLNVCNNGAPQMCGTMGFSVSMDIWMCPLVAPVQEHSGMEAAAHSVEH